MTVREFLSDRFRRTALQIFLVAVAAAFLVLTGTAVGTAVILLIAAFIIIVLVQIWDFWNCRARLEELQSIMEGLDKKYLFAECVPLPKSVYERRLFYLFRRCGKAMIEAVSDARSSSAEYREYVESWIHEIKTPITAARLIGRNIGGEAGEKLSRELGQMEAHVERVLFYARAESPEKDYVIRQCRLGRVAADAVSNHQSLLIQSGVRIEMEELDYQIYTDEKWASFIIGQLLQNSARYRRENPVIALRACSTETQVQLFIKDNGIGIPAHELPRVFDRGFTGSNGRIRGGSTGMGLYLCRKLAGFLEISVRMESKEGEGTTVCLTFPAKRNLSKM